MQTLHLSHHVRFLPAVRWATLGLIAALLILTFLAKLLNHVFLIAPLS